MGRIIQLQFLRRQDGAAAIEFAVVGGVFCMILVVGVDISLGYYSSMQVQTASQMGAQYAAVHGFDATKISNAVTAATSTTGISTSPAPTQFCGCAAASTITTATCGTSCSDGMTAATYVRVTATRNYTPILPSAWLPASYTQTYTSTVRIK
ncbi:MAG TPA: TadE/TadG family type IV pilus assembly protein [Rhizomicrobium sp.]|nr:TadE/TadG family type IV pilus assembly protein [Rhizomicrobium sp.]